MAFAYTAGVADDIPDWFDKLETFLTGVGWTIQSGGGTTTVVFKSTGEEGGRLKLYIRFRRESSPTLAYRVWHRVQDDAAGTHGTTEEINYVGALEAEGLGEIPFNYWMNATKDQVICGFKRGSDYTGSYDGIVEPFALTIPDEEYQMIAAGLHLLQPTQAFGYVLRRYDDAWSQGVWQKQPETTYIIDPLDNSCAVLGTICGSNMAGRDVGELFNVTSRIIDVASLNPEDVVTSGQPGATATWLVLGTGVHRWMMRTGGTLPLGGLEGAHYAHTSGLATSTADFHNKLFAFLTSVGWTVTDRPVQEYPIDKHITGAGENGTEDMWIRWRSMGISPWYVGGYITESVSEAHNGGYCLACLTTDFPTYYYITADRDCFMVAVERAGVLTPIWFGKYITFNPNSDALATPYKVGQMASVSTGLMLRGHEGTWLRALQTMELELRGNSSPNQYDGTTYIVWPHCFKSYGIPIGVPKYWHQISGSISVGDTVAVGGNTYKYLGSYNAMRIT